LPSFCSIFELLPQIVLTKLHESFSDLPLYVLHWCWSQIVQSQVCFCPPVPQNNDLKTIWGHSTERMKTIQKWMFVRKLNHNSHNAFSMGRQSCLPNWNKVGDKSHPGKTCIKFLFRVLDVESFVSLPVYVMARFLRCGMIRWLKSMWKSYSSNYQVS